MSKKTLDWGRTPWDEMSREELLREVQRMYSALVSLSSALKIVSEFERGSPFYGKTGSGGLALEKARQILEPIRSEYGEDEYRSFFRYADDLLFDRSTGFRIGSGWAVCPVCGVMLGETAGGESEIGKPCRMGDKDCPGIFRALTWEDLAPNKEEENTDS